VIGVEAKPSSKTAEKRPPTSTIPFIVNVVVVVIVSLDGDGDGFSPNPSATRKGAQFVAVAVADNAHVNDHGHVERTSWHPWWSTTSRDLYLVPSSNGLRIVKDLRAAFACTA